MPTITYPAGGVISAEVDDIDTSISIGHVKYTCQAGYLDGTFPLAYPVAGDQHIEGFGIALLYKWWVET